MKEHPIIFSGPMVRAILEGHKSQTRRVVRPQPHWGICLFDVLFTPGLWKPAWSSKAASIPQDEMIEANGCIKCPYGIPGDRLWVRETWVDKAWSLTDCVKVGCPDAKDSGVEFYGDTTKAIYKASYTWNQDAGPWKSPIYMPRWASRITLEITDIRVQRLQEISEEDARAEGVWCKYEDQGCEAECHKCSATSVEAFHSLWDSINAKRAPWKSNPWVWAISFKRIMDEAPPWETDSPEVSK